MEYIKPLRYQGNTSTYSYTFLNALGPHIDIQPYYSYLESLNKDNVYYNIRLHWFNTQKQLSEDSLYKQKSLAKYYNLTSQVFNDELTAFIDNDPALSIFVMNMIQKEY